MIGCEELSSIGEDPAARIASEIGPVGPEVAMATMKQKVYRIGGQKVISTAVSQHFRASRRRSLHGLFGGIRILFRLLSHIRAEQATGREALPASPSYGSGCRAKPVRSR